MNKLSCIPKTRISEGEVDIVCAYYGLSEEVSKYIQRLAFSNHLPFTMPSSRTTTYTWEPRGLFVHGCLWIWDKRAHAACTFAELRPAENGRRNSINSAVKSIGGITTTRGGIVKWKINDRSITEGKLRNEVRNYFFTLDGIFQQKSRIHSHDRAVCLCAAHYKRLNRSSWKII